MSKKTISSALDHITAGQTTRSPTTRAPTSAEANAAGDFSIVHVKAGITRFVSMNCSEYDSFAAKPNPRRPMSQHGQTHGKSKD
jgi:hypothetical protein